MINISKMQSTISISKGCFAFNPRSRKSVKVKKPSVQNNDNHSILGDEFTSLNFYKTYSETWTHLDSKIEELVEKNDSIIDELLKFVVDCQNTKVELLPTIALLTGVNQPDHFELFKKISKEIHNNFLKSRVVILQSRNCINLKFTIETMVSGIIDNKNLTKSQCNMSVFKSWYSEFGADVTPLVFITIPDLELFNSKVLQDFFMILSSNYPKINFILILGIATDISTLHRIIPFTVTNKMFLRVSQSLPSTITLSQIVDKVILTPHCPVNLSSKVFNLLIENFLYHDMSINCFLQRFKYCLMEHYYRGNIHSICAQLNEKNEKIFIKHLSTDELKEIRQLPSYRKYIETIQECEKVKLLQTKDEHLRKELPSLFEAIRNYFALFQCGLKILCILLHDIPSNNNISFKELRSLYPECAKLSYAMIPEFNECWKLLELMSKKEFIDKMWCAAHVLTQFVTTFKDHITNEAEKLICDKLTDLIDLIKEFDMEDKQIENSTVVVDNVAVTAETQQPSSIFSNVKKRHEIQQRILQQANKPKIVSHFTKCVRNILNYIRLNIFDAWLIPFRQAPTLHELFLFDDYLTIKSHIVGAPRAVLQTALTNPQYYLQCNCCTLNADNQSQIIGTMPDVSIAYKLHIESGHTINLFDWLQAFNLIINDGNAADDIIHPEIQARFTRAVAELQFLGYIKSSKRKTDHVTRLTW